MKHVVLCPNPYKDKQLEITREAIRLLEEAGIPVRVSPEFLDDLPEGLPADIPCSELFDVIDGAGLVVSLGGDGTFMHTARRLIGYPIPMLGVNLGTVGFLAELDRGELPQLVEAAKGNFVPSPRMMLQVEVHRGDEVVYSNFAMNDAAMHGIAQTIHMTARGDGRKILEFSGDGVVISSPTGSTAYSMSAGGPIVEPTAENLILIARSFVLAPDRVVTVQVTGLRSRAFVAVDGASFEIMENDILRVKKAEHQTLIAHVGNKAFYDIVFEKLGDAK